MSPEQISKELDKAILHLHGLRQQLDNKAGDLRSAIGALRQLASMAEADSNKGGWNPNLLHKELERIIRILDP